MKKKVLWSLINFVFAWKIMRKDSFISLTQYVNSVLFGNVDRPV